MKTRIVTAAAAFAAMMLWTTAIPALGIGLKRDLKYEHKDGCVDITKNGKLVARYVYKDTPKPYIYPVIALNGVHVTRGFPMEEIAGEPTDHPHHRSFWIGFGDVNGVDFWTEGENKGKIVQKSIEFDSPTPGHWNIHTKNDWVGPDGKIVCQEERRYSFMSCEYGVLISTMITLEASHGEVKLGDNKEGFFAFRMAPQLQLAGGTGHILNSKGNKDNDCWGKRAGWCDYTGVMSDGKAAGIAILDVPVNQNSPTYWHARDYGLFATNPFAGAAMTGDKKNDMTVTIPKDHSKTWAFVALIHDEELDGGTLVQIADQTVGRGTK